MTPNSYVPNPNAYFFNVLSCHRHHQFHRLIHDDIYTYVYFIHACYRGTGIFVHKSISTKVIDFKNDNDNIEIQILKIQINKNKSMIVCCIYRHPNYKSDTLKNDHDFFHDLFNYLTSLKLTFYVLGDFNLKNKFIKPLVSYTESLGIKQLITVPTRLNNVLDLIFTNENRDIQTKVFDGSLADHSVTDIIIRTCRVKAKTNTIQYRNYKNICIPSVTNSFDSLSPNHQPNSNQIISNILQIFDSHAPVIRKEVKKQRKIVFVSTQTKSLIKDSKRAYKLHRRMPSTRTAADLHVLKRKVKAAIRLDTKQELNKSSQNNFWNGFLNRFDINKKAQNPIILNPNDINDFYVSITRMNNSSSFIPSPHPNLILPEYKFSFNELTPFVINRTWSKMKNTKSKSPDPLGICPLMFNIGMLSVMFTKSICNMFNEFIHSGTVPAKLKISRVVPVPKIENPLSPNDTRPISIQPLLTKFFEKCLLSQLNTFIADNNVLSPYQFGFRKNLSTSHALIAISDHLYKEIDLDNFCILVSLDFQKAFDKVDRRILFKKLNWYGINEPVLESLLSDRMQYVECQGYKSETKINELGVVQGSSLSALLFSIMVNDLPVQMEHSSVYMFADDSNLIISGKLNEIDHAIKS